MSRSCILPGLVVFTAFAIAACGGSSSGGSSGSATQEPTRPPASAAGADAAKPAAAAADGNGIPNACTVLSADIAKKYLGPAAKLRRNAQPNPKESQCQWGSPKGVITVMVGPWSYVSTMATTSQQKAIPGIGDQATVGPIGLYARKGELGLDVNVITLTGDFYGAAANAVEQQASTFEQKIAPELLARM